MQAKMLVRVKRLWQDLRALAQNYNAVSQRASGMSFERQETASQGVESRLSEATSPAGAAPLNAVPQRCPGIDKCLRHGCHQLGRCELNAPSGAQTAAGQTFADWWDTCGRADEQALPIRQPLHIAKLGWDAAQTAAVSRNYCEACGYVESHDPNCPAPAAPLFSEEEQ